MKFVSLYRRDLGIRVRDVLGTDFGSDPVAQTAPATIPSTHTELDSWNDDEPAAKSRKFANAIASQTEECLSSTVPKAKRHEQHSASSETASAEICKLDMLRTLPELWPADSPAFFHDSWREQLCRCNRCLVWLLLTITIRYTGTCPTINDTLYFQILFHELLEVPSSGNSLRL